MSKLFAIGLLMIIELCPLAGDAQKFIVSRIDSTSNNYLIFLNRGNLKAVIISPKDTNNIEMLNRQKLIIGNSCAFKVDTFWMLKFVYKNDYRSTVEYQKNNGISVDGVLVPFEFGRSEIYQTSSLIGLYYEEK